MVGEAKSPRLTTTTGRVIPTKATVNIVMVSSLYGWDIDSSSQKNPRLNGYTETSSIKLGRLTAKGRNNSKHVYSTEEDPIASAARLCPPSSACGWKKKGGRVLLVGYAPGWQTSQLVCSQIVCVKTCHPCVGDNVDWDPGCRSGVQIEHGQWEHVTWWWGQGWWGWLTPNLKFVNTKKDPDLITVNLLRQTIMKSIITRIVTCFSKVAMVVPQR